LYRRDDSPFYVIGHRGSPRKAVENTISSFETAIATDGANALELDLCITADGEVVVWHDWDPDSAISLVRSNGYEPDMPYQPVFAEDDAFRRPVNELTLEEFREHYGYCQRDNETQRAGVDIPTFEDFVRWASAKPPGVIECVFLDVKIPEECEDVVERFCENIRDVITRYNFSTRIIFESYHENILQEIRRRLQKGDYTVDAETGVGLVLDPEQYSSVERAIANRMRFATLGRPRAVTFAPWTTYRRIIHYELRRRHKHNCDHPELPVEAIVSYTINDRKEMRTLIAMGVNGIQSDVPELLREVVDSMKTKVK
jgi:glycerophosphoryl diester phosphodiesterase